MAVGSPGFCGSKWIVGGTSSICTASDWVVVFGWPCGPTALFQAVHDTVWTPSPFTVTPGDAYVRPDWPSTPQLMPPTPDGPAVAVASTVTAWSTQMLGLTPL